MKRVTPEELLEIVNARGQIINEIQELHKAQRIFDTWYCTHCLETIDYETDQAEYPCETMQIIHKFLGADNDR